MLFIFYTYMAQHTCIVTHLFELLSGIMGHCITMHAWYMLCANVFGHPLTHTLPSTTYDQSITTMFGAWCSQSLTHITALNYDQSVTIMFGAWCFWSGTHITLCPVLYYVHRMFSASLSTKAISWTHLWPCKCIVVVSCVGLLHDIAVNLWDKANYKPRVGSALHRVHQVRW